MTQEDKDKALMAAELLYGNDEKAKRAFITGFDYSVNNPSYTAVVVICRSLNPDMDKSQIRVLYNKIYNKGTNYE